MLIACAAGLAGSTGLHAQDPIDYTFSYQGRLKIGGTLAEGPCLLRFTIWDSEDGGSPLADIEVDNVAVEKGLFTAVVDLALCDACDPTLVLNGEPRWIEVEVECPPAGGRGFTSLGRQPLTTAPFASYAFTGGSWQVDGNDIFYVEGDVEIGEVGQIPTPDLIVNANIRANAGLITFVGDSPRIIKAGGDLLFGTEGGGNFVAFTDGGLVGVGTTAPAERLHVLGTSLVPATLRVESPVAAAASLVLESPSSKRIVFGGDVEISVASNGRLDVLTTSGPQTFSPFSITQSNRVGINNPEPDVSLDVIGDISVESLGGAGSGSITAGDMFLVADPGDPDHPETFGSLTADGTVSADGFICTGTIGLCMPSDRRLKTDIQSIPDALVKLGTIRGVYFRWRDAPAPPAAGQGREVGVIAQEVNGPVPEAVRELDDGTLAVAYDRLVPVLIEAIKELNGKLEERDRQVAELSDRLAAIEAAVLVMGEE